MGLSSLTHTGTWQGWVSASGMHGAGALRRYLQSLRRDAADVLAVCVADVAIAHGERGGFALLVLGLVARQAGLRPVFVLEGGGKPALSARRGAAGAGANGAALIGHALHLRTLGFEVVEMAEQDAERVACCAPGVVAVVANDSDVEAHNIAALLNGQPPVPRLNVVNLFARAASLFGAGQWDAVLEPALIGACGGTRPFCAVLNTPELLGRLRLPTAVVLTAALFGCGEYSVAGMQKVFASCDRVNAQHAFCLANSIHDLHAGAAYFDAVEVFLRGRTEEGLWPMLLRQAATSRPSWESAFRRLRCCRREGCDAPGLFRGCLDYYAAADLRGRALVEAPAASSAPVASSHANAALRGLGLDVAPGGNAALALLRGGCEPPAAPPVARPAPLKRESPPESLTPPTGQPRPKRSTPTLLSMWAKKPA